jgi:hypothetical protein
MDLFIVIPALIAFLMFFLREYLIDMLAISEDIFILYLIILLAISLSFFMMRYLQTGKTIDILKPLFKAAKVGPDIDIKYIENQFDQFRTIADTLKHDIMDVNKKVDDFENKYEEISDDEREIFVSKIIENIENTASEKMIEEIENKIENNLEKYGHFNKIEDIFIRILNRLYDETYALGRRGNLNLILGIITTIGGLIVLYIYVDKIVIDPDDPMLVAAYFLPRLTLVIFIEVFAYFFLRLYKANLSEIKYFQNEITNVETKFLSLKASWFKENENSMSDVLKSLSETERNFKLEKGQSTVDLEREKIESEKFTNMFKAFYDLNKKIKIKD